MSRMNELWLQREQERAENVMKTDDEIKIRHFEPRLYDKDGNWEIVQTNPDCDDYTYDSYDKALRAAVDAIFDDHYGDEGELFYNDISRLMIVEVNQRVIVPDRTIIDKYLAEIRE